MVSHTKTNETVAVNLNLLSDPPHIGAAKPAAILNRKTFHCWLFLLHFMPSAFSNKVSQSERRAFLSTRSFVIAPSGFSDLEVDRSVTGRILNVGNITVHSQSESDVLMVRVRDPLNVSKRTREVLSRPIVRIEADKSESNE
jgi:hypothetical protein